MSRNIILFVVICFVLLIVNNFADKRASGVKTEHIRGNHIDGFTEHYNYLVIDDYSDTEFHYNYDDNAGDIFIHQRYNRHVSILLSEDDQMSVPGALVQF